MSFRKLRYRTSAEVRVREVPELELCLAYVPRAAELFTLNALSWYVLRQCDGRSAAEIARAYYEAMVPQLSLRAATKSVQAALDGLVGMGIVEAAGSGAANRRSTTRRKTHGQEAW